MNRKVHYEIFDVAPNESDIEGSSYLMCGREYVEKTTTHKESATCKQCLRRALKGASNDR